jgi:hypothetical protein
MRAGRGKASFSSLNPRPMSRRRPASARSLLALSTSLLPRRGMHHRIGHLALVANLFLIRQRFARYSMTSRVCGDAALAADSSQKAARSRYSLGEAVDVAIRYATLSYERERGGVSQSQAPKQRADAQSKG